MRVSIEHREEQSGSKQHYFVDCEILFSEEEKAVIQRRSLADNYITTESAIPIDSGIADFTWSNTSLRIASRICVLLGVIMMFFSIFTSWGGFMAFLFFAGSLGIFLYRRSAQQQAEQSYTQQQITIGALLRNPRFTVFAPNPAVADAYEHEIRDELARMKHLISASTELRTKQTFEL